MKTRTPWSGLHGDESGTAMTEFVFFLPVWIVVFVGIINLGQIGITATKVEVTAQKNLWDKALQVPEGFMGGSHMSPRSAAPVTGAAYAGVAGAEGNPQSEIDIAEGLAMGVGMEVQGHYGESCVRTVPLQPLMQDGIEPTCKATDVLGTDKTRYPHLLLNDTLAEQSFSGGWEGVLASAVGASGLVPAIAAGIRYGSVFAEESDTVSLLGGAGSITAAAHFDVIVAPRPISGLEADTVTFAIAFLAAKLDKNYKHYQQFGKTNWGGGDGTRDTPSANEEDIENQTEQDKEKECDRLRDSWDEDADPPQPKPEGLDKCD